MGSVDFISVRSRDALHAVVASAEQDGAEGINGNVADNVDDFGLGAAALVEPTAIPVSSRTGRDSPDCDAKIDD